jgi:putative heme-binding domain-containing protein
MPKVRQFAVRRLTEAAGKDFARLDPLVEFLTATEDVAVQRDVLLGMRDGLRGRRNVPAPTGWEKTLPRLASSGDERVSLLSYQLGLIFNDPRASEGLHRLARDPSARRSQREAALQFLAEAGVRDLKPMLLALLKDEAMRGQAMRALAGFADPEIPTAILKLYPSLRPEQRQDALATLASRPAFALALLDAVEKKAIARTDISPFTARQMQDLKDAKVADRLARVWGQVRHSSTDKKALIAKYKSLLTADVLKKADPTRGRAVYQRTCFQCHSLFGEGNKIGPDLTGSNRNDLHYVLENIIDPSAIIGRDYQLTNVMTASGRLVAGIVVEETDRAITLQTANEKLVISRADIDERQVLPISMMPEGQIEQLTFAELRDLVAYLASKEQVPLPAANK